MSNFWDGEQLYEVNSFFQEDLRLNEIFKTLDYSKKDCLKIKLKLKDCLLLFPIFVDIVYTLSNSPIE